MGNGANTIFVPGNTKEESSLPARSDAENPGCPAPPSKRRIAFESGTSRMAIAAVYPHPA